MGAATASACLEAQSNDLSSRRAELIKTTDGKQDVRPKIDLDMVDQIRECNIKGTKAYELARENADVTKAWRECVLPVEGEREEETVGVGHGNSHRHDQVLRKLRIEVMQDSNRLRLGAGDARGYTTSTLSSSRSSQHDANAQARKREAAESLQERHQDESRSRHTYQNLDDDHSNETKSQKKRSKSRARKRSVPNPFVTLDAPTSVKRTRFNVTDRPALVAGAQDLRPSRSTSLLTDRNSAWSAANLATSDNLVLAVTKQGTVSATVRANATLVDQTTSTQRIRSTAQRAEAALASGHIDKHPNQQELLKVNNDHTGHASPRTTPARYWLRSSRQPEKPFSPVLKQDVEESEVNPFVRVASARAKQTCPQQDSDESRQHSAFASSDRERCAESIEKRDDTVNTHVPTSDPLDPKDVVEDYDESAPPSRTECLPPRPAARVRTSFGTSFTSQADRSSSSTPQSEQRFKPPTNTRPIQSAAFSNPPLIEPGAPTVSPPAESGAERTPTTAASDLMRTGHARHPSGLSDLTRDMASLRVENQAGSKFIPRIGTDLAEESEASTNVANPTSAKGQSSVSIRQCQELSDGSLMIDGKKYILAATGGSRSPTTTTATARNGETSIASPPPTPKFTTSSLMQSKYADPAVSPLVLAVVSQQPEAAQTRSASQSIERPTSLSHTYLTAQQHASISVQPPPKAKRSVIGKDLTASKWASR